MAESRGVGGVQAGPGQDALSGEALYNLGMAHYRRREWRQAQKHFLRLKALDPRRRGIDALLDELAIFIRLDSSDPDSSAQPDAAVDSAPNRAPSVWWLPVALVGAALVAALALLAHSLIGPQLAWRSEELRAVGRNHIAARAWSMAIDAYEQCLLLTPGDAEARSGLWTAYYERGLGRMASAEALEAEGEYARAAERWEGALADFRAAQQVDAGHPADPRGETLACIERANSRRCLAASVGQALDLAEQQRWAEAVQVLQAVRAEDPGYCQADVSRHLGQALYESARAALARAETLPQVQRALQQLEEAAALPGGEQARLELAQARDYLRALEWIADQEWDEAILALELLLEQEPEYAGGQAFQFLCTARWQRAEQRYLLGDLHEALADYQALTEAGCGREGEAGRRMRTVEAALTPAAAPTPTPMPARGPAPTATIATTLTP